MKQSIALLTLGAMSLTLGACGGSSKAPAEKKAEASQPKKGAKEKPHENPWAIETPGAEGDAAKAQAKPKAEPEKGKGKAKEANNPWAKDTPTPASTE